MKYITILFVLNLTAGNLLLRADYRENFPSVLIQPDGDTLHCFITGDEFYRVVHDTLGYPIVMNPDNGWYVYAVLAQGNFVPTSYVPGRDDPRQLNLTPNVVEADRGQTLRETMLRSYRDNVEAPSKGNINFLVVSISFLDKQMSKKYKDIEPIFNDKTAGSLSVYSYFRETSYGALLLTHHFYPKQGSGLVISSVTDSQMRNYYKVKSSDNPSGYVDANERREREFNLLVNAVNAVKAGIDPALNLDADNDGYVDNVVFIIAGGREGWSDLLWPHRWALYGITLPEINGKKVKDFIFLLEEDGLQLGTVCHETFHTFGAPDLYHYTDHTIVPVGAWDLMASNSAIPQQSNAHMKERYGKWVNVPMLERYGVYTLYVHNGRSSVGAGYRINAEANQQSFLLEYRKEGNRFDADIPDSGLLIYRIDQSFEGNASYDGRNILDEVYVYRPSAYLQSVQEAPFGIKGRDSLTVNTDPKPLLSDGTVSGNIRIEHIQISGDTLRFYYGPAYKKHLHANLSADPVSLQVVQFRDISSSDGEITERSWKFPGGIPQAISGVSQVKVYYRNPGSYKATLTVKNVHQKIDTWTRTVIVP